MKKKDEIKKFTATDLAARVETLRRELFSLRLSKTTKPLKDTATIKKIRREIARTLTFLQQKQESQNKGAAR